MVSCGSSRCCPTPQPHCLLIVRVPCCPSLPAGMGIVTKVGSAVTGFKEGQRVTALGWMGECSAEEGENEQQWSGCAFS